MYYRKKHSLYILTSCHLLSELIHIHGLVNDLFDRPTSSNLLTIQGKIKSLIVFVQKLRVYKDGERKPKMSIYLEDKNFILSELKCIDSNIVNSLTGSQKILNGCNTLNKIYALRRFIYLKQTYWYNSELERNSTYSNYFDGLKKPNRKAEF